MPLGLYLQQAQGSLPIQVCCQPPQVHGKCSGHMECCQQAPWSFCMSCLVHRLLQAGERVGDINSRKGKLKDLQNKPPNYEKLYKHLKDVEWPAAGYEKDYWQQIYS